MHAGIKMFIGILLVLGGLWLLVPVAPEYGLTAIKPANMAMFDWWEEFLMVLKGVIPPMIIIFGALVVWIESEELKTPEIPEIEEPVIEEPKKKKSTKKKKTKKKSKKGKKKK